jgi:hypothetical protein
MEAHDSDGDRGDTRLRRSFAGCSLEINLWLNAQAMASADEKTTPKETTL